MANVENPYQIDLGNNLVVTSWVDKPDNEMIIKFADVGSGSLAYLANDSRADFYGYGLTPPKGEIISCPDNLKPTVIAFLAYPWFGSGDSGLDFIYEAGLDFYFYDDAEQYFLLNRNVAIIDTENENNYLKLGYFWIGDKSVGSMTLYHKIISQNNVFYNWEKFYESYLNKEIKFKFVKYNEINQNLILSENYNGEIIDLSAKETNNGFYLDDISLEYLPYKCISNFYKTDFCIKFADDSTYNKLIIQYNNQELMTPKNLIASVTGKRLENSHCVFQCKNLNGDELKTINFVSGEYDENTSLITFTCDQNIISYAYISRGRYSYNFIYMDLLRILGMNTFYFE